MKRIFFLLLSLMLPLSLFGCGTREAPAQIAATTLPVYEFTAALCQDTPLTVTRLVTEEISCLHDYSLNVRQVRAAEAAQTIVISGAGLEEFMEDLFLSAKVIDASQNVPLLTPEAHSHEKNPEDAHDHSHEDAGEEDHEGHHHEKDPHIWLSPVNAMTMAENICRGLCAQYPRYETVFQGNLEELCLRLQELQQYGEDTLQTLSCRELITFHDGFSYFADSFGLTILEAMEEESGSEASARELIRLIEEVEHHQLPAVFTEKSGSVSAAGIISRETGAAIYCLDMAMASGSYFDAMYQNINTIKEALK